MKTLTLYGLLNPFEMHAASISKMRAREKERWAKSAPAEQKDHRNPGIRTGQMSFLS